MGQQAELIVNGHRALIKLTYICQHFPQKGTHFILPDEKSWTLIQDCLFLRSLSDDAATLIRIEACKAGGYA